MTMMYVFKNKRLRIKPIKGSYGKKTLEYLMMFNTGASTDSFITVFSRSLHLHHLEFTIKSGLSKPPHYTCTSWNNKPQENSHFTTLTQPEVNINFNGSKPDHRSCEVFFLRKISCLEKHLRTAAFLISTSILTKLLKKK